MSPNGEVCLDNFSEQGNLFSDDYLSDELDICVNFHRGARESEWANQDVAPSKAGQRAQIVAALAGGPRHCEGLEDLLGMKHQTVSARLSELLRAGSVGISGHTYTRSGSRARVYYVPSGSDKISS